MRSVVAIVSQYEVMFVCLTGLCCWCSAHHVFRGSNFLNEALCYTRTSFTSHFKKFEVELLLSANNKMNLRNELCRCQKIRTQPKQKSQLCLAAYILRPPPHFSLKLQFVCKNKQRVKEVWWFLLLLQVIKSIWTKTDTFQWRRLRGKNTLILHTALNSQEDDDDDDDDCVCVAAVTQSRWEPNTTTHQPS